MSSDIVNSVMRMGVERNLLKYCAGHNITCPHCGDVMDWTRTSIVTIYRTTEQAGSQIVKQLDGCCACIDKRMDAVKRVVEKANALPGSVRFTIEVVDGRNYRKSGNPKKQKVTT